MRASALIPLLAVDPDLGTGISGDEASEARRLVLVPGVVIPSGRWDPATVGPDHADTCFGAVVVTGLLTRERLLADGISAEIVGPGDVLDAWSERDGMVPTDVQWSAVTSCELALLDRRFLAAVRRWPVLAMRLLERAAQQNDRLSIHASINGLTHVEQRLLAMLWHLAGSFGKVRGGGRVALPMRLTHEALGRLIGARRPTVTLALKTLAAQELLETAPDGGFVLREASRSALVPPPRDLVRGLRGITALEPIERAGSTADAGDTRALGRLQTELSLLRDAEQGYRALFKLAAIGVALIQLPSGGLVKVNDLVAHLLGRPTEKVLGMSLWDAISADDVAGVRRQVAEIAAGDRTQATFECRLVRADGSSVWTRMSAALLDRDGPGDARIIAVIENIAERKSAEAERDALDRELAADLEAMQRLLELGTRVAMMPSVTAMLEEILDGTIALQGAQKGNIQLHDDQTGLLVLTVHRGFSARWLAHFGAVDRTDPTSCGRALRTGGRVMIEDVELDPDLADLLPWAREAGFRAVCSTPLYGRGGRVIGMLSTHFDQPRRLSARELHLTDLYHRLVVELVERARAEEAAAADLAGTELLRDLGARMLGATDLPALADEVLAAAIALGRADGGTVQVLDEETQELVLLAARGFGRRMTANLARVDASSRSACGRTLAAEERIVLDYDDPGAADPDGSLRLHRQAGYATGQSTPLVTRAGTPVGMLSTHWRTRRRPTERELRFLDLLARQAADLMALATAERAVAAPPPARRAPLLD